MTDGDKSEEQNVLPLQVGYWSKRLDHTLTHTATSSRLMYLVDGAVLALLYFSVQTFGISPNGTLSRWIVGVLALPTALLVILSELHVRLLRSQGLWYSEIDGKLLELLKQEPARERERSWSNSTHGVYRVVHHVIAVFLLIATVVMVLYAIGCIPELPVAIRPVKTP